jgi:predicted transcriptional regulator
MATSVHIPKPLLEAVDRRARRLKLSRNRFIVKVLEKELERETHWSPGFFEKLADVAPGDAEAIDVMLAAIRKARTRKAAPPL